MSPRTSPWPTGTPCWTDLAVPDVEIARSFYSAVLGWHIEDSGADDRGYLIATVDDQPAAGIGPLQAESQPIEWLLYFATDDVDITTQEVIQAGGTLMLEPGDVGRHGRMAVGIDPTGASFGLWQAGAHLGSAHVNAPGGLTWEDLRSTEPAKAQEFYTAVFGYAMDAVDMAPGDYRTFSSGADQPPLGGMGGFMGPAGPSHWAVYFGVASTDDTLAAATLAGGEVVAAAFDTPYGRMGSVADPHGAVFQVIEADWSQMPDRSE